MGTICTAAQVAAKTCEKGEVLDETPIDLNYSPAIVWLDTLLVLFLFLFSRSNANTIKFGMSWHIYFMMNFMNPAKGVAHGVFHAFADLAWDDEENLVRYTSYAGVFFAILATFVPRPLLMVNVLQNVSSNVTDIICGIWQDTIDYVGGRKHMLHAVYIQKSIDVWGRRVGGLKAKISAAWWETFGAIGSCGRRFELVNAYSINAANFQDILYIIQGCLPKAVTPQQVNFYAPLLGPMEHLREATAELLRLSLSSIQDGSVDDEEKEAIHEAMESAKVRRAELLQTFATAPPSPQNHSRVHMLLSALLLWSDSIQGLAAKTLTVLDENTNCCRQAIMNLCNGLYATWNLREIFADVYVSGDFPYLHLNDHLKFCFRNYLPITLCFVIGYTGKGPFKGTGYSSVMASTLSLLITPYAGNAFQNNTQRLLGVTLGKTLPILIFAVVAKVPSGTVEHTVVQMLTIWIFVSGFCYIYYTSLQWALVGCLAAGFGVVTLVSMSADMSKDFFADRYTEIGQVTFAIFIQLSSDALLRQTGPRQKVVTALQGMKTAVASSFSAFFQEDDDEEDSPSVFVEVAKATAYFQELQSVTPQTEPRLQLAPGLAAQFKVNLLRESLPILQLLQSDLNLLAQLVRKNTEAADYDDLDDADHSLVDWHSTLIKLPGMQHFKEHLDVMLEATMDMLIKVLGNTLDQPADLESLGFISKSDVLDPNLLLAELSSTRLPSELRLRGSAAVEALASSSEHLQQLQMLCIKENHDL